MKGYKTSKDYKKLRELLDDGYSVIVMANPFCMRDFPLIMERLGTDTYTTRSNNSSPNIYWSEYFRCDFNTRCEDDGIEFLEPQEDTKPTEEATSESVRSRVKNLEVDESFEVSLDKIARATCSYYAGIFGKALNRKYKTRVNKEKHIITITRVR